jgi:hypothetical protein
MRAKCYGVRRLDAALDDAARRIAGGPSSRPVKSGVEPPHSIDTEFIPLTAAALLLADVSETPPYLQDLD